MPSSVRDALLASVKALVATHEICVDRPWLGNLFAIWRRHGLGADRVRPLEELIAVLSNSIRKRTKIASYAVFTFDDAHTRAELIAAVERAASGQRPFGLVSWRKSEVRAAFAAIRVLNKPPDRPEQWQRVLEVLAWRKELESALARWRALAVEFSLPPVSNTLDDAARALQAFIDSVNLIADAIRLHIPLVQREVRRLFPFGLSAAEIVDDVNYARWAVDAIGSEVSRLRLSSARAKLDATKEKLKTCTGRISRNLKDFVFECVGLPDVAPSKVADIWTRLLTELERVRTLRPHLETVERIAESIADSGAPKWAQSLRTIPVDGVEDVGTPGDWQEAWIWAQADLHLRTIDGRARLHDLDDQRHAADDEMRRLVHDVVRLRTLLTLKARITRRVDAALQMFLTAVRRIGKGTGKSASRLRRERATRWSLHMRPCHAGLCQLGESRKAFLRLSRLSIW